MTKEIKLGKSFLKVLVDDEDYEIVKKYSWYINKNSRWVYAKTKIKGRTMLMHRMILETPYTVDHANGNGLDNRRSNLRPANLQDQKANCVKVAHKKYKGVGLYSYGCRKIKYRAQIEVNDVNMHIGYFDTEDEAALAYNICASLAFGEYARLNERIE
jgi:hypothetical protein